MDIPGRPGPANAAAAGTGFPPPAGALNLGSMDVRAANDPPAGSDEDLMLAYADGDLQAFGILYGRHRIRLYRYLLQQVRDGALADDLFQDIWQRVVAARATWRPDALFTTWLFRIAHNRLTDHWRALAHRPPAPHDAEQRTSRVPDPDTPERRLSDFEEHRRLRSALDGLPFEQREAVLLRLEQELSLEEIGEVTGVGRETVKSRLRYAMDKLRAGLEP